MSWNLVPLQSRPAQSWRNGGGVTRELLAWPQASDWRVRMSVADVQASGPFSRFDGIERWFAVLEGDGLVLRTAFAEHRVTAASEPFRFDGELHIEAAPVLGPTRDFNLMALPGRARMERVRGAIQVQGAANALLAVYAHGESALLRCAGDEVQVPPYHLAWRLASAPLQAEVHAQHALWMEALA